MPIFACSLSKALEQVKLPLSVTLTFTSIQSAFKTQYPLKSFLQRAAMLALQALY